MADLSVKYLGLPLKNPIIAGSSGLTRSINDLRQMERSGVAAIAMQSLFEEQICLDADYQLFKFSKDSLDYMQHSESFGYIDAHIRAEYLSDYVQTIREAKKKLQIPVIASINCVSASGWTSFAAKLQDAGADALELNIAVQQFNSVLSAADIEHLHLDIINMVRSAVSIPIAVKISPYFADLSRVIDNIAKTGIAGIILFNRFYSPDIDIDRMKLTGAKMYSTPTDLLSTLRWIAMKSGRVPCDLCASTGVHRGSDIIKILLTGGAATQVVSAVYQHGFGRIAVMLNEIEAWMARKEYNSIKQFAGKMGSFETETPATYERIQFMKYHSNAEKQ